jgi:hypothetical protein
MQVSVEKYTKTLYVNLVRLLHSSKNFCKISQCFGFLGNICVMIATVL